MGAAKAANPQSKFWCVMKETAAEKAETTKHVKNLSHSSRIDAQLA
jgi:hypothetical protein